MKVDNDDVVCFLQGQLSMLKQLYRNWDELKKQEDGTFELTLKNNYKHKGYMDYEISCLEKAIKKIDR
jgi:hypothetical protein